MTLAEIENGIVTFKEARLKWQAEQNNLDVFSSCSMEALKEDMTLEGEEHTDDVQVYL